MLLPPPGEVGRLRTLKDLSAIIAHGGKEKQFVCLKFTREDCKGCKQSEPLFAERAAQHTADGLFFEVRYEGARAFCWRRLNSLKPSRLQTVN